MSKIQVVRWLIIAIALLVMVVSIFYLIIFFRTRPL